MNQTKVELTRTGDLKINGVAIEKLIAIGIKSNGTENPTITIMFDVDEFEIAVGVEDFTHAISVSRSHKIE